MGRDTSTALAFPAALDAILAGSDTHSSEADPADDPLWLLLE